jgi:hypothetical protein
MAKPDCDDGWFKLSHELDAALAVADFTKGARIVLREVFSQIYGPAKRTIAVISAADLGRRYGRPRQYFSRALEELDASGSIRRLDPNRVRFAKDYSGWTFTDGSPRLTTAEISACSVAPQVSLAYLAEDQKRAGTHQSEQQTSDIISVDAASTELMTGPNGVSTELMTPCHQSSCHGVNSIDDGASTELMTNSSPPKNPLLGRRIENREMREEQSSYVVGAGARLQSLAGELFSGDAGERFGRVILGAAAEIESDPGLDCYEAAMKKAARHTKPIADLHAYCLATGKAYRKKGIPPEAVAAEPKPAEPPPTATQLRRKKFEEGIAKKIAEAKEGKPDAR